MNKALLIISGVVIAAAFIAIDFDGLSQSANVASSTSEMFLEDGNNEATGSSTMPIDVIATTSATQEATTTDTVQEVSEPSVTTTTESVSLSTLVDVAEENFDPFAQAAELELISVPQSREECFTEQAREIFGNPRECFMFIAREPE